MRGSSSRLGREARRGNRPGGRSLLERLETRVMLSWVPAVFSPISYDGAASTSSLIGSTEQSAAAAATVAVNVSGRVMWTDAAGGTHPVPLAAVQIRSTAQANGDPPLATAQTDLAGNYTATVNVDVSGGAVNLFARIFARNPAADVKPDTASPVTYFMDSAAQAIAAAGNVTIPTRTASNANANNNEQAFSILGATLQASTYAANLAIPLANMPSQVDVRFPSNTAVNGTASFFDPSTKRLFITQKRVFDWDVIQHEYGHYVQDKYAFPANAGGSHTFFAANAKPGGPGLAWNEGWATFFAISAQVNTAATYAAGVPGVGNTSYDPTGGPTANFATQTGVGELDEFSDGAALYHLMTGDQGIKISDKTLFQTFVSAKPMTFGAAWDALAASRGGLQRTQIGKVLGLQKIAPVETGPSDGTRVTTGGIPTFTWQKNGSNDFVIQFYTSDFKTLIDQTANLGNVSSFTPDAAEWAKIFNGHSTVKWVVEGKDTTAPATPGGVPDQTYGGTLDRYWSSAGTLNGPGIAIVLDVTGSMSNEIGAVQAALVQYISDVEANLLPGEDPPTVELITFVDAPTEVISSDDLDAVKAAVQAQFASGGGDTPEPSAQSLEFAAQSIAPGGTILLITDASSDAGTDLNGTIEALRAKGVTVNAEISGDDAADVEPFSEGGVFAALTAPQAPAQPGAAAAATHAGIWAAYTGQPASLSDGIAAAADEGLVSDGPEPVQQPINDPGQTPTDDAGDSLATATRLGVDAGAVEGVVGNTVQDPTGAPVTDNNDFFVCQLAAGTAYNIPVLTDTSAAVTVTLLDRDGATVLKTATSTIGDPGFGALTISITPTATGDYFIKVSPTFLQAAYTVQVSDNPLVGATSSFTLFSTAAAQTGGTFVFNDAVAGSPTPDQVTAYRSSILNVMDSTFRPSVLTATPGQLPLGLTLQVTLTGRGTNWTPGFTSLSFSNPAVHVNSVAVNSATSLTASVTVDSGGVAGFSDVAVHTTLGSVTETATGSNVVQVTAAPTTPTTLEVQPGTLARGQTLTVTVFGTLTNWNSTATLSLGPGITVGNVNVVSPTLMTAQVQVDPAAALGFRAATVTVPGVETDRLDRAVIVESTALSGIPSISTISPPQVVFGQHYDVAVVGSNTSFVAGQTTASFGSGVTVSSVDVTDATHAVVHIDVAASTAPGFRDVTLTTGTETAALLDGLFVSAVPPAPLVTGIPSQTLYAGINNAFSLGSFTAGGSGPWAIDVNWGDGTPDTTFTADAPGSLDPQDHTYTTPGAKTLTVTVTDANDPQSTGGAAATINVVANLAVLLTDPVGKALAATGTLNAGPTGIVYVNSQNPSAASASGRATALAFDVAGATKKGSRFNGAVNAHQPRAEDPLAPLPAPDQPSDSFAAVRFTGTAPMQLQPGTYVGGIKISGAGQVTMAPGIYYIQGGGFSVKGKGNVVGDGVMIYNTGAKPGAVSLGGRVKLTPPTTGTYAGIVLFQDRAARAAVSVSGAATLTGTLYAPSAKLSVTGHGNLTEHADPANALNALIIALDLNVSSSASLTIDTSNNTLGGSPTD